MASGRSIPLSLPRRFVGDLVHFAHQVPTVPVQKMVNVGSLERLRSRYTVVVLTVLSWSLVVDSSKRGGLSWDGVLSCEFLGHYKPDPEAYLAGVTMLGLDPRQVMMVAAHPWDLRSAAAVGMRTAYVPRPGERGERTDADLGAMPEFDLSVRDFTDLAGQLVP